MTLAELLKHPEGKNLEFKRDLSSPEGVLRTIVAFANTSGGTLLIGVEDGARRVRGLPEPLDAEERLANLVADHIAPRLVPEIDLLPWRRTQVLAVQVHPSPTRPHYLLRLGPESGTYVRVGSTNRRADAALVEELRRVVRGESYDEQVLPDTNSEAIDFRAASESFAPVRKLARADLETLRLVARCQGRKVATVGGVLLFGIAAERERLFPDAWIQAGRFRGADRSRIADGAEIRAPSIVAVESAIAFVHKHMQRAVRIGKVRRIDEWSVPPVAVREAVINAVVHADYAQRGAPIRIALFDDRLEIENPGLLPFGLTVDDLRAGVSRLRNRVIGRVFHELKLIEQWGSGIQRMSAACARAGLPEPGLEEVGMRFRVTLASTPARAPALEPIDRAIMAALAGADGVSTGEVSTSIGRSTRATRTRLQKLIGLGLAQEVGSGPNDPQRRYFAISKG